MGNHHVQLSALSELPYSSRLVIYRLYYYVLTPTIMSFICVHLAVPKPIEHRVLVHYSLHYLTFYMYITFVNDCSVLTWTIIFTGRGIILC